MGLSVAIFVPLLSLLEFGITRLLVHFFALPQNVGNRFRRLLVTLADCGPVNQSRGGLVLTEHVVGNLCVQHVFSQMVGEDGHGYMVLQACRVLCWWQGWQVPVSNLCGRGRAR